MSTMTKVTVKFPGTVYDLIATVDDSGVWSIDAEQFLNANTHEVEFWILHLNRLSMQEPATGPVGYYSSQARRFAERAVANYNLLLDGAEVLSVEGTQGKPEGTDGRPPPVR